MAKIIFDTETDTESVVAENQEDLDEGLDALITIKAILDVANRFFSEHEHNLVYEAKRKYRAIYIQKTVDTSLRFSGRLN